MVSLRPDSTEAMVKVKGWLAVCIVGEVESVTCTVKLSVTAAAGVPLMFPVAESKSNPDGKLPAVILHMSGGAPPVAWRVTL